MQDNTTLAIGDARVTVLNAGDLRLHLAEEMAVPEEVWRPSYADLFEPVGVCPSLSVYIEHAGARTLVDIGNYRATVTPESGYALDDYTPPPAITAQLASLDVAPADISQVVITHAHWDHLRGVTTPGAAGGYAPTFPQARYALAPPIGRTLNSRRRSRMRDSLEARTLGALHEQGKLHLVAGREQIAEGIEILPAPGETPGHQIVRVHSNGATLYIVGDLFHHAIEVEHPDWMVTWADPATMLATREWLLRDALAEQAQITAAHIFGVGRIEQSDSGGLRWRGV